MKKCWVIDKRSCESITFPIPVYTNNERACNHKHFYESDSEFLVRADGEVTGSRCVLSFLEFQWSEKNLVTPCISLCIRITQYSLGSCDFKMIYSDGLGDPLPKVRLSWHPVSACASVHLVLPRELRLQNDLQWWVGRRLAQGKTFVTPCTRITHCSLGSCDFRMIKLQWWVGRPPFPM